VLYHDCVVELAPISRGKCEPVHGCADEKMIDSQSAEKGAALGQLDGYDPFDSAVLIWALPLPSERRTHAKMDHTVRRG
jgi:hypothetical protein